MNDVSDTKYVKVFIGRFQPFHMGHLKVLRAAIDTADCVVVMIGSAQRGEATLRNPWNLEERRLMILGALTTAEREKVVIAPAFDMPGKDSDWVKAVKADVRRLARLKLGTGGKLAFTLIGCHKGADTYYLKLYRGWNRDLIPQADAMNATDVRTMFFGGGIATEVPSWWAVVPGSTAVAMTMWRQSTAGSTKFWKLVNEQHALATKQINEAEAKEKP